jgi:hypothetical protein
VSGIANLNRSGRRPGVPNKHTGSIKEMILGALKDVGGQEYLAEQARKNPVAFLGLVAKVLPLQLANADGSNIILEVHWQPAAIVSEATSADTVKTIDADAVWRDDIDAC